jgi:ATP:corrinoid adenosyltransferase
MKKTAFFLFAAILSLNVAAQSFEINVSVDSVEVLKRNSQTGRYDFVSTQSNKSSVLITDSLITVTDQLGQETRYRVFANQGSVYAHTEIDELVTYNVINDKTGEFFEARYVMMEFEVASFSLSNDMQHLIFTGKKQ